MIVAAADLASVDFCADRQHIHNLHNAAGFGLNAGGALRALLGPQEKKLNRVHTPFLLTLPNA
jgi:hypothetical protein